MKSTGNCSIRALADYRLDRFEALMTTAAVRYLGAEVPEPACDAGMLERFMREIYAVHPMPTRDFGQTPLQAVRPHTQPLAAAPRPAVVPVALLLRHDTRPVERKVHPVPVMRRRPYREVRRSAVRPAASARQGKRSGPRHPAAAANTPNRPPGRRKGLFSAKNQKIRPFIAN